MLFRTTLILFLFNHQLCYSQLLIPISSENRRSLEAIQLTSIGEFGIKRKARPGIPEHLHTGVDIMRPNGGNQFIYPVAKGIVISKRTDGPYAQLIVEHILDNKAFWSVYEHISDIQVFLYQEINPNQPIARFFNNQELDRYGWQFNHFHFEVLKERPIEIPRTHKHPDRLFNSYTLVCHDQGDLKKYFFNPLKFLKENF